MVHCVHAIIIYTESLYFQKLIKKLSDCVYYLFINEKTFKLFVENLLGTLRSKFYHRIC